MATNCSDSEEAQPWRKEGVLETRDMGSARLHLAPWRTADGLRGGVYLHQHLPESGESGPETLRNLPPGGRCT